MEVQLLDVSPSLMLFRLESKKLENLLNKILGAYINLINTYFWWLINPAFKVYLMTLSKLLILYKW